MYGSIYIAQAKNLSAVEKLFYTCALARRKTASPGMMQYPLPEAKDICRLAICRLIIFI
jgi:hypothetical protein